MRPLEVRLPKWLNWRWLPRALLLWPFILYRWDSYADPGLVTHYIYHWEDAKRWGVVGWYVAYVVVGLVWLMLRRPHPMERWPRFLESQLSGLPTRLGFRVLDGGRSE